MKLKYDTLDQVEEKYRGDFVEWKDGEKTVFVPQEYADQMKEHFRLKGDFTELKTKSDQDRSRLDELSSAENERKRVREAADLEEKKKGGKYDEIISDWERKHGEAQTTIEQMKKDKLNGNKQTLVERLASAGTESSRSKLSRLINQDLGFDDKGAIIVLDSEGKATSKTVDEYKTELKVLYPELVAEVQSRGGKGNGGLNSGANGATTMKRSDFEGMDHGARAKFFKDGGKLTE
jgi:hypothetical protein